MLGFSAAETSLCPFSPEQSDGQEQTLPGQACRLTPHREASSPSGVCSHVAACPTSVGRSLGPPLNSLWGPPSHQTDPLLLLPCLLPPLLSPDVMNLVLRQACRRPCLGLMVLQTEITARGRVEPRSLLFRRLSCCGRGPLIAM